MGMQLLGAVCFSGLAVASSYASASSSLTRLLLSSMKQSPDDATQALRELDVDGDGYVQLSEVSGYASAKGLDYQATVKEFASYDADHNGRLDAAELANVLGLPPPSGAYGEERVETVQRRRWEEEAPVQAAPASFLRSRSDLQSRASQLLSSAPAALHVSSASTAKTAAKSELSGAQRVALVSKIAEGMAAGVDGASQAQDLELQAAEARAQLATLKRQVAKKVIQAGSAAAYARAQELAGNLTALEAEALRTEVKAAAVRTKMDADVKQVNDLSAIVREGLTALHAA
uniref:EF-hand domain-containing protein n=1 Tax=Alexandrium catenella TaxID=2925 RepID=A0A7S1L6S6_ALECA